MRFSDEETDRLKKMLKKRRLSGQAFIHAAAMRALNEAELGKKTDPEVIKESREDKRSEPKGLGIRQRLQDDRDRDDDERIVSRSVEKSASTDRLLPSVNDEVMSLARTIVAAPKTSRSEMLKTAIRALAVHARSETEALALADDLNAAIKRIEGTPPTALERVRARAGR